ncbi:glycosyl hydrolase 5 family protein [Medicago truncatula]|uniref:glycosyl hydrolase 5 family protein n=1 Tax=Medicago truncatula TaxID=3880 RepID=UPI000D2F17D7|nr:glycosyl hydrolase 5 family protein [Medicago truncatula]
MVAEGLDAIPLKDVIAQLKGLGFDCVRYTWATYMFTRYSNYKVGENLDKLNLTSSRLGIGNFNPSLESITVVEAFDFVVDEFGKQGMMVLADNHVSDPKWCCDNNDGNGCFGDQYFNLEEWLQGLSNVANRVKGKPQIVAVGLRNELRGPGQNNDNWYKYMSQGVTTVHKANPNVLVFVSGLNYDTDLSFLKTKPLNVNIGDKLVYEAGFLMSGSNPNPLVMTEFGMDMENIDDQNQRYLSCILAYLGGVDLDWALWAAQGSYYIREKENIVREHYGLWSIDFSSLRYQEFPQRFQLLQKKLLEPSSNSSKSYIIYHPLSGQCVKVNSNNELELGHCEWASKWNQEGQHIKLVGNGTYIEANSDGSKVKLSKDCKSKQSFWKTLSTSQWYYRLVSGFN